MDVVDDAEGPLDPRIQIELENLNTATDNINKLEIELDEAHTAFAQLLSEWTRRRKDIASKLGANCIDRARCYYDALEVSRQAQVQCQYQAQLFQKASEIHAAAKETVALAEARFMSHQHEWNFDQAWQDMLNHATIKVMDAENQKAECGREHHRRATLYHDAEMKVQQLEEKYRRSISKAGPYIELRAQYEQMLATQKERVECLQKAVKDAKRAYSSSFRALEEISNQIHQQRRDYDMVANGPREPGVGAELISPEESLSYEAELNKVSISRLNSLASSGEPDMDDRSKDFDDVQELRQRVDQLGGRSIDGSESFSSQWELELQASMEKLNNLTMKNSNWETVAKDVKGSVSDTKDCVESCSELNGNNSDLTEVSQRGLRPVDKSLKNDQNERKRLPMEFRILKKLSPTSSTTTNNQGWQSLTNSPINSILNRSKIAIRNSISKSLSNSPVNMSFSFGKSKIDNAQSHPETPKLLQSDSCVENSNNRISSSQTSDSENEANIINSNSADSRISTPETSEKSSPVTVENEAISQHAEDNNRHEFKMPKQLKTKTANDSERDKVSSRTAQVQKPPAIAGFSSRSVDSTPVRSKTLLTHSPGRSFDHPHEEFVVAANFKAKYTCKTSSVRELPLLSLFEATAESPMSKDKSCSLINLAEKNNLKSLLSNADLENIQAVRLLEHCSSRVFEPTGIIATNLSYTRTKKCSNSPVVACNLSDSRFLLLPNCYSIFLHE